MNYGIGMGGASCKHRYKNFSRATIFVASVTRPSNFDCFDEKGVGLGRRLHVLMLDPVKLIF